MSEDTSNQDVSPAADSSVAAPTSTEVIASAGVTAASDPSGGESAPAPKPVHHVPYERFQEVTAKAREHQRQYAEAQAKLAEAEKRQAEYEAKLAKAQEEPPAWWTKQFARPEPEPDFGGDPALEKAYHLEKAIQERDARIQALESRFDKHTAELTEREQARERERQQAVYVQKLEVDFGKEVSRDPSLARYSDGIYALIAEGRAQSVPDAVAIFKAYYLTPAAPAAVPPAQPSTPGAPPVVKAPPRPPPVLTGSAPHLIPGKPPPKSIKELTEQIAAKYSR